MQTVKDKIMNNDLQKAIKLVFEKYGNELPRFKIGNMNQAEFIIHVMTIAYNNSKEIK